MALILMNTAQPALFYLCPVLIICSLLTSILRKEFHSFWSGDPVRIKIKKKNKFTRIPILFLLIDRFTNLSQVIQTRTLLAHLVPRQTRPQQQRVAWPATRMRMTQWILETTLWVVQSTSQLIVTSKISIHSANKIVPVNRFCPRLTTN